MTPSPPEARPLLIERLEDAAELAGEADGDLLREAVVELRELQEIQQERDTLLRLAKDAQRIIESHSGKDSWVGTSVLERLLHSTEESEEQG